MTVKSTLAEPGNVPGVQKRRLQSRSDLDRNIVRLGLHELHDVAQFICHASLQTVVPLTRFFRLLFNSRRLHSMLSRLLGLIFLA